MKNIQRGSTKHLILLIAGIALCGFIIYPLFDLIFCQFVNSRDFVYSVPNHIVQPIIGAVVSGSVIWAVERKMSNK